MPRLAPRSAPDYNSFVGASEDARARATLNAMQARLAKGPHDALGLASNATPGEIRTAFLELTKVYHPARFSRLSVDGDCARARLASATCRTHRDARAVRSLRAMVCG